MQRWRSNTLKDIVSYVSDSRLLGDNNSNNDYDIMDMNDVNNNNNNNNNNNSNTSNSTNKTTIDNNTNNNKTATNNNRKHKHNYYQYHQNLTFVTANSDDNDITNVSELLLLNKYIINKIVSEGLRYSIINRYFGNVQTFVSEFDNFIENRYNNNNPTPTGLSTYDYDNNEDNIYDNSNNNPYIFTEDDHDDDDDIFINTNSNNSNSKKVNKKMNATTKKHNKKSKQFQKGQIAIQTNRNTKNSNSIFYLLDTCRQYAELDSNGLYFLCNINDILILAQILDDENNNGKMSLNHKYIWSMAPVSTDDDKTLNWYKMFIRAFTNQKSILYGTNTNNNNHNNRGKNNKNKYKNRSNKNKPYMDENDEEYEAEDDATIFDFNSSVYDLDNLHLREEATTTTNNNNNNNRNSKNKKDDSDSNTYETSEQQQQQEQSYTSNINNNAADNINIDNNTNVDSDNIDNNIPIGTGYVYLTIPFPAHFYDPKYRPQHADDLIILEKLHQIYDIYLWLYYRFPYNFPDKSKAIKQKQICTELIALGLQTISVNSQNKTHMKNRRLIMEQEQEATDTDIYDNNKLDINGINSMNNNDGNESTHIAYSNKINNL